VAALLGEAGLPVEWAQRASIDGHDPVLPSRFPVGEAAATALAACGVAATGLAGSHGEVRVEVRRAAASLIGFALQSLDNHDHRVQRITTPLAALYRCADGRFVHLHGVFPHLAAGTRAVLGITEENPTAATVARAVAGFDASPLEDALAEAGMCGAMVRTAAEWADHPQGRAIGAFPRIEMERIGDAPPEPLPRGFDGVRVLDLTRILAGPACGRTLASHGADVLLVSSPKLPTVEPFVIDTSPGKRSAFLDLDEPAGVERLTALVRDADVFTDGYRAGALERRGFGPRALAALRPGIVAVSINCYGNHGPWEHRPGWEQLAQSVTGLAAEQGSPGAPALVPAAACDYTTGYLAALGVMAALWRRSREGGSWQVRVSLTQTAMWLQRLGATCDEQRASGLGDLDELLVTSDSGFGRLTHLPPALDCAGAPARWHRPSVPLGTHLPGW